MNSLAEALRAGLYGIAPEISEAALAPLDGATSPSGQPRGVAPTAEARAAEGAGLPACPGRTGAPTCPESLGILLQPRPLILTGLPYKPTTQREVTRTARTGAHSRLTVTYLATNARYGLPFGADRALLAWITTRAYNDGFVPFDIIRQYLHAFELDDGGRGYRLFRERYLRVVNLALRVEEISSSARSTRRLFVVPASKEPTSLDSSPDFDRRCRSHSSARFGLTLDATFWRYLRDTGVPTPLGLLRRFHHQPQAWDFCQLVLFRCYSARTTSWVPWEELLGQLGATTNHPRRLKAHLNGVLHTVRSLYPDFPARFLPGLTGLEVDAWRPPMSE